MPHSIRKINNTLNITKSQIKRTFLLHPHFKINFIFYFFEPTSSLNPLNYLSPHLHPLYLITLFCLNSFTLKSKFLVSGLVFLLILLYFNLIYTPLDSQINKPINFCKIQPALNLNFLVLSRLMNSVNYLYYF